MNGVDLVVFDMAGTTIEVGDLVASAFGSALEKNGVFVERDEIRERMGASKREVIRTFVERQHDGDAARLVEWTYSDFNRTLCEGFESGDARPVPGAEETFSWLRENDVSVALTTGFDREVADAVLKTVGWEEGVVDASLCSDDVSRGRPAPYMIFRAMEAVGVDDVGRVVAVGDTPLDLQAGANARAGRVVGVLSGRYTAEQLGEFECANILPSVVELPELIETELRR